MLGIEYYGFAIFLALLVSLIILLCKYLFAGVKQKIKLLDERESKLLKLYQSVEDVLEEFSDQAAEARSEIEKLVGEARAHQLQALRIQTEALDAVEAAEAVKAAATEVKDTARTRETKPRAQSKPKTESKPAEESAALTGTKRKPAKSGAKTDGVPSFQKIIDEMESDSVDAAKEEAEKFGRNETIIALKAEGKSIAQIAQELGITQNEVKLVIGLYK